MPTMLGAMLTPAALGRPYSMQQTFIRYAMVTYGAPSPRLSSYKVSCVRTGQTCTQEEGLGLATVIVKILFIYVACLFDNKKYQYLAVYNRFVKDRKI